MKAKLVWNFTGDGALETADHHLAHLKQYCKGKKVEVIEFGVQQQNEFSAISFVILNKDSAMSLRTVLKPHQGFFVD
tara:strand:- start:952 stop:1182 length:231 start_codon:yes stop_codon:yes gene_type:complete